jgi:hypothetical protein
MEGVLRYEDTEEYTYSLGDAAASYSPRKLRAFDRHFLWLKTVAGKAHPAVVVFDQVESTSASFEKTYLLHTQNRPEVRGNVVTAENRGGELHQQTLLPSSPRIDLVGGSGKEFWVNGRNFAPTRAPTQLEEGGTYRVEISPSAPALADLFLHVLYACDAGGSPPTASLLDASTMTGLTVEDWTVLLSGSRQGIHAVEYTLSGKSPKHLLFGMVPNATYDALVDGAFQGQLLSSAKGTLRFDSAGSGRIQILLSTSEEPAS